MPYVEGRATIDNVATVTRRGGACDASALVTEGCDTVVALGVLHGAREQDAELVARARAGEHAGAEFELPEDVEGAVGDVSDVGPTLRRILDAG